MIDCEEYIQFVTGKIKNQILHQQTIQSRDLDYLTNYGAEKKIEALKDLANDLGVEVE